MDFAPTIEGGPNVFVLMDTKEITVRKVETQILKFIDIYQRNTQICLT